MNEKPSKLLPPDPFTKTVLIIEDDRETVAFVSNGLEARGFACASTGSGLSGLAMISKDDYDVAIIDIRLPDISGFELIRLIRDKKITTPLIVLSSMNTPADKIAGLNCGADDYLGKPFARDELIARIDALLRRASVTQQSSILRVKDLCINTENHEVLRGSRHVELTSGEFALLEHLMRNAGKMLSTAALCRQVWGSDYLPSSPVVETRICFIRRKLCADGEPNMIFTVKGFGYVLR